jgi:hypothetical protein
MRRISVRIAETAFNKAKEDYTPINRQLKAWAKKLTDNGIVVLKVVKGYEDWDGTAYTSPAVIQLNDNYRIGIDFFKNDIWFYLSRIEEGKIRPKIKSIKETDSFDVLIHYIKKVNKSNSDKIDKKASKEELKAAIDWYSKKYSNGQGPRATPDMILSQYRKAKSKSGAVKDTTTSIKPVKDRVLKDPTVSEIAKYLGADKDVPLSKLSTIQVKKLYLTILVEANKRNLVIK